MLNFLSRGSMKNGEKGTAKMSRFSGASFGSWLRIITRFLQMVMGIVVIGLYAQDLMKAQKMHKYADPKWVFATFTGSLGATTAIVFMIPIVKAWFFFYLDFLIFFFYLIVFGIFGKMYIKEDPEGNKGILRMKNAVWVLVINMILWIATCIYGAIIFYRARKARAAPRSHV